LIGLASGIDCTAWHGLILGAERRGAALGLRAHRAEGVEPIAARPSAAARNRGILVRWIKQPNGRKSGGARHRLVRKTGRVRIAGRQCRKLISAWKDGSIPIRPGPRQCHLRFANGDVIGREFPLTFFPARRTRMEMVIRPHCTSSAEVLL
jgi:hypothetical protein